MAEKGWAQVGSDVDEWRKYLTGGAGAEEDG